MPELSRRRFTRGAAAGAIASAKARDSRPNVVIFYVDELRATALRLYNRDGLLTPNLARLARRGVTFHNALTPHPLCMPARVSLWTGRHSSTHGSRGNQQPLAGGLPNLAEILQRAGYKLGIFGKNHCFTGEQLAQWFDADYSLGSPAWNQAIPPALAGTIREYRAWIKEQGGGMMPPKAAPFPAEAGNTHLINQRALEFIQAQGAAPFCAWISIPDPHHPIQAPETHVRRVPASGVNLPPFDPRAIESKNTRMRIYDWLIRGSELPESFLREFLRVYYAMTLFIDDELGRLMDLLDRRGLAANTILLFTSDHGDFAAEHHLIIKTGSLLDSLARIPLVVSWPGRIPAGHREEAPVSQVDIMPTLLRLCGLAAPESVEGRPLPLRQSDPRRAFAYSEYGAGGPMYTWEDARAIGRAERLGDYPLGSKTLAGHLQRREAAGHLRMVRTNTHKLIVDSNGEREFYDLTKDPHEFANVQGQAAYQSAEARLQRLLDSEPPPPRLIPPA